MFSNFKSNLTAYLLKTAVVAELYNSPFLSEYCPRCSTWPRSPMSSGSFRLYHILHCLSSNPLVCCNYSQWAKLPPASGPLHNLPPLHLEFSILTQPYFRPQVKFHFLRKAFTSSQSSLIPFLPPCPLTTLSTFTLLECKLLMAENIWISHQLNLLITHFVIIWLLTVFFFKHIFIEV